MRVNIDKTKTTSEYLESFLQKIWPRVYKVTNWIAQTIFSNVFSFLQSFLSQLSGKRKII